MSIENDTATASPTTARRVRRDKRKSPRLPLRLKVAIVYHLHEEDATRPTYHGTTFDISVDGLSVTVAYNIFNDGEVTVLLALPPTHPGGAQTVIEATAKMVYTVYSAECNGFRVGLMFRKFKRRGKTLLEDAINRRTPMRGED